ncbi:MAG: hypothetical protein FD177_598 [Desulfovibrionaceae bacterium]|nr:MAG: hypothetical protein FD177_598 [Desulfovibrionaceae bacterium]
MEEAGTDKKVDVLINVCGKPYQTALALLTLERASGHRIDRIYFVEENTQHHNVDIHTGHHGFVLDRLKDKIVYLRPETWNYCFSIELDRLGDEQYRHSVRYQYGWENSDKDHVLIIHNDAHFHGDVVGAMLDNIDGHIAIGHVGQCWYCPASFTGKCGPDSYLEYKPSFRELRDLYTKTHAPEGSLMRAYHLPRMHPMFEKQPWPLPECRVNEWCALIDMKKARGITAPHGRVTPFGAILSVGKQILDVGCQWFRDVHVRGHTCKNFDIYKYMHHDVPPTGQPTLLDRERYEQREIEALARLREEFGHP